MATWSVRSKAFAAGDDFRPVETELDQLVNADNVAEAHQVGSGAVDEVRQLARLPACIGVEPG